MNPPAYCRWIAALRGGVLLPLLFALGLQGARADSATWNLNPVSNDWNTPENWTPATVPMALDTATFGISNVTSISAGGNANVASVVFNPTASTYTFVGTNFTIGGITNSSGAAQTFSGVITVRGPITGLNNFIGSATILAEVADAGISSFTGGFVLVADNATAANATFTLTSQMEFSEFATAGNATITNNGATTAGGAAVTTEFFEESGAGTATIINNGGTVVGAGGGRTTFSGIGNSSNGTLIANGGSNGGTGGKIFVQSDHFDGTARLIVNAGGVFDMSGTGDSPSGFSVGSIEGAGDFFLSNRATAFKVGSNNLSTAVAGVIHDGAGFPSLGGLLTKTGSGTLTLTHANSYSAGTIIEAGALEALSAGALGSGDVSLTNAGTMLKLHDNGVIGAIGSGAALGVVSGSTVNLDFTGIRPIASLVVNGVIQAPGIYGSATSGAPHQIPEFTGNGLLLVTGPTVASRRSHGGNIFDLFVSRGGVPTVEPRSGGLSNTYQLVVSYLNPVTFSSVSVTSGTGMVTGTSGNGTSNIIVDLAGVTNQQRITITLFGVNDGTTIADIPVTLRILIGDVNGDGMVNVSDVGLVAIQSGEALSPANFRADVTANGVINASDIGMVKSKSGTSVAVAPAKPAQPAREPMIKKLRRAGVIDLNGLSKAP